MKQVYTIVVFTENKIGLLNRVTSIFTQRHVNIESLSVSDSEFPGIHRFTIVIEQEQEKVEKIAKQIEKQVEVLKAYYFKDEDTVFQEIALYKVDLSTIDNKESLFQIIEDHGAIQNSTIGDLLIIEKTGHKKDTHALFEALQPYGIIAFVRSGRVSLSRYAASFSGHLEQFELHSKEIITNHN
ncbi:MAG: acetolactate synthase small subunit [bacterium]|nr:acetolactate synthase small subunit [bacterium]